jgi:probable HAF family extracellular repeat protein
MPIYTYTTIDHPAATGTIANDINNADQIVGFSFDDAFKRHGYLLSGGVFTPIDDPLAKANGFGTWASGINATGQVVGFSRYDNGQGQGVAYHGFFYNNGGYLPLDNPSANGQGTLATDINNAEQVVGYWQDPNNGFFHGFILVAFTYVTLDDPMAGTNPFQGTFVQSINDAQQIVGYYIDNAGLSHGFLAIPSQGVFSFTTLDGPLGAGNVGTFATGINNAGQITGFYDGPGPTRPTHGFLYSNGVYTTLDDPLATNGTAASGINDAGQIVGTYHQDTDHGFLATLGPNPPPPGGTTAAMILRGANTSTVMGEYEIYNIGNNAILAAYQLGHVGTD